MSMRLNTLWAAGLLSLATLVGCGGGGGGGGSDVQAIVDLSGTWEFTTQQTANSCDTLDPEPSHRLVEIVQDGTNLTVTDLASGDVIEGSVSGTTVTLSMVQEFDDAGELVRVELDATLDAAPEGNTMSGASIARAFVLGVEACAIEDSWSGVLVAINPPPPATLDVAGRWDVVGDVVTDPCGLAGDSTTSFEWDLVQVGAEIEIVDGADTLATGTLVGTALDFSRVIGDSGFVVTVDGSLQFAPDAQSFTGSFRIVVQDGSEICEGELALTGTRSPIAPPPPPVPALDLTGEWSFALTPSAEGCPGAETSDAQITLVHSGDQVTLLVEGTELTGTLVGDQLTIQSEPEEGVTLTILLTVLPGGDVLVGTYTVTLDGAPCDLIADVEAVRI